MKSSEFGGGSSDIGDVKLRVTAGMVGGEGIVAVDGQEWLRAGFVASYAAKYAVHTSKAIGRRLYCYKSAVEASLPVASPLFWRVLYDGARYIVGHGSSTTFLGYKAALDSSGAAPLNAGAGLSEAIDIAVITSGANAGRVLAIGNGRTDVAWKADISSAAAWQFSAGGVFMTGVTNPGKVACKPDGSLCMATTGSFDSTVGSNGFILTSVDGFTNATQRNPVCTGTVNPAQIEWCASLGKFVIISNQVGTLSFHTTANGYTLTKEAGTPFSASQLVTSAVADNGAACVVIGNTPVLYRSLGGAAFSTVTLDRILVSVAAAAGRFYALDANGVLLCSTDNGATFFELGQINGPSPSIVAGHFHLRAANGQLFYSSAGAPGTYGASRFTLQPAPTLAPDQVGMASKLSVSGAAAPVGMDFYTRIF